MDLYKEQTPRQTALEVRGSFSFISKHSSLRSQKICAYYALDASERLKKSISLRSLGVLIVFSWQVVPWTAMDCVCGNAIRMECRALKGQTSKEKRCKIDLKKSQLLWLLVSQSVVLVWIGSDFCLTLICHIDYFFPIFNKSFTHGLKWNVKCVASLKAAFSAFPGIFLAFPIH